MQWVPECNFFSEEPTQRGRETNTAWMEYQQTTESARAHLKKSRQHENTQNVDMLRSALKTPRLASGLVSLRYQLVVHRNYHPIAFLFAGARQHTNEGRCRSFCTNPTPGLSLKEKYAQVQVLMKEGKKKEGLKLLKEVADQGGHQEACYNLAVCYGQGLGTAKSAGDSLNYFKKAASQGHIQASYVLGAMYATGQYVEQNVVSATYYLQAAADEGHVQAQVLLGKLATTNKDTEQEGVEYLQEAADAGDTEAQLILAGLYGTGRAGLTLNKEKASEMFKKAADEGSVEAQYSIGGCYSEGIGVSVNYKEAVRYLDLAASKGHREVLTLNHAVSRSLAMK